MMKNVRKAVRTFLFNNEELVVIKYGENNAISGFLDLPGGKIEENETSIEAAIREFKEETTMDIYNPKLIGKLVLEYETKIFDLDIYVTNEFSGTPQKTIENDSFWINKNELNDTEKLAVLELLSDKYSDIFNNNNLFNYHFYLDSNHQIIEKGNLSYEK